LDSRRLFIALWPSSAVQRELTALIPDGAHGVSVRPENVHLTLAFLGNSSAAQEASYRRVLSSLKFTAVALDIQCLGFWREPRILWAGPKETSAALVTLVEDIHALLWPCGFTPEPRPFHAHITLKRKYPGPAPDWGMRPPVRWLADTVALVWSHSTPQGVCYKPLLRIFAEKAPHF
jgi:2'-5' RNA ligase